MINVFSKSGITSDELSKRVIAMANEVTKHQKDMMGSSFL
jgi:hypothetical protein